jgi:oligopeptide/dipeptide ABC transporter ATP-binding protein
MDGSVPHQPLLSVENLYVQFHTLRGVVHALDGVSLAADHRQAIGLVGETGCGKSVTARAILRLIEPPGRIVDGAVRFEGRDLMALSDGEIRDIRGARISMILQEPRMSLNPVMRAGDQVAETLLIHDRSLGWRAARRRSLDMLAAVSIPDPGRMARRYPHELALDVTIQAQILDLMTNLIEEIGTSVLMITHDLGIVAETCDRVVVMYAGQVVETGPVAAVLRDPQHPYTSGLLKTLPEQAAGDQPLYSIEGNVPSLLEPPRGCRFAARCEHVMDRCWGERPPSYALSPERQVACFLHAPG